MTGNLDVRGLPNPHNVTAIEVASDDVTIDLGGFTIVGPNFATPPASCTRGTNGFGIVSSLTGILVRNGRVRGMGYTGVAIVGVASRIEDVFAGHNCARGFHTGSDSAVVDSQAYKNAFSGILVSDNSRVQDSIASENAGHGIEAGSGTIVAGCVARANSFDGVSLGNGLAIGNVARSNTRSGISSFGGSTLVHNTSNSNGSWGFNTAPSDSVGGNTVIDNVNVGFAGGQPIHCNNIAGNESCPSHP